MPKSDKHKAREIAQENFKKEVLEIGAKLMARVENNLRKFEQDAFNLAVKHSETIKEIKEEIVKSKNADAAKT